MCSKNNVSKTGVQTDFNDLNLIKQECLGIKRPANFKEQEIKDIEAIIQMDYAYMYANRMCRAKRRKVAAVLYKNQHCISTGFNGTPPGEPNECEYEDDEGNLITKPNVIHAERNAFYKLQRTESGDSPINSAIFVTTACCPICAEPVAMSGVSTVYFTEMYRGVDGLEYLIKRGVTIKHIDLINQKITTIYQSDAESNVDNKVNGIIKIRELFKNYYDGKYHNKTYNAIS